MHPQRHDRARLIADTALATVTLIAAAAVMVISLGYPLWPYGTP
jgi:4'-phosphopantetheinyl transferase EntD